MVAGGNASGSRRIGAPRSSGPSCPSTSSPCRTSAPYKNQQQPYLNRASDVPGFSSSFSLCVFAALFDESDAPNRRIRGMVGSHRRSRLRSFSICMILPNYISMGKHVKAHPQEKLSHHFAQEHSEPHCLVLKKITVEEELMRRRVRLFQIAGMLRIEC